jgi:hypothetical protein
MEQGQSPQSDVLKLIESQEDLWIRLVAAKDGNEWLEALMEITSTVAPPNWVEQRWEYDEAIFISMKGSGSEVAKWFQSGIATIGNDVVKLPIVTEQQTLSCHRLGSKQKWGLSEPLEWPSTAYDLAYQPLKAGPGFGSFISGGSPSFVRFAVAAASFFGVPLPPGGSVDNVAPIFRLQNNTGRITRIRLGAAEIEVHVEGSELKGMTVELASDDPGPTKSLSKKLAQVVKFALPNGLPSGAWVVLKRDSEWIDRKFLNWPNTMSPDPSVEVVVEPLSQLETLVASGEGPNIEFKQEVPESTSARRKVSRTLAAFANGDGGHLLFGVEDDGKILGLPAASTSQVAQDAITRFISSLVAPLPNFSVHSIALDDGSDRAVIVVTVESGEAPPYGVGPENPQYYIRRGATTFPASADVVRALARSRPVVAGSGSLFG